MYRIQMLVKIPALDKVVELLKRRDLHSLTGKSLADPFRIFVL